MSRFFSTKALIGFVFSFLLFLYALVLVAGTLKFSFNSNSTKGTVSIGLADKPYIAFSDTSGNSHIKPLSSIFSGTLSDGQVVSILYNSRNPAELNINSFLFLWAINLAVLFISGVLLILSLMSFNWPAIIELITGKPYEPSGKQRSSNYREQDGNRTFDSVSSPSELSTAQASKLNLSPEFASNIFGILKPLVDDPEVSDIIMASPNKIFVKRGSKIIKSDVVFPSTSRYEEVIDRMLTVADTTFSIAKPIVDGMVNPMVRIHAVHEVLCEEGPYVTLRISRLNSLKFQDLCRSTMAPREVYNYLRGVLLTGHTILVAGEVGTGKTSLIRGLAATIPERESILVIEDTPEIKIEHPVVRYVRTRASNVEGVGKVSPGECIKAGMRMAMNRIIFGEIRDPEAAESFIDVCVSGHPGMSTIHARSASDAVARLELFLARQQAGVERYALREQIASAVQVVVHTIMCSETNQRRIDEIIELKPGVENPVEQQVIFRYSIAGKMPVWKVENRASYFQSQLREFENGSCLLTNLPDYLALPQK
jgi:pilus assembly protein CpaF